MYLLFDIGGTKTRIAVVEKDSLEIRKIKIFPTLNDFSKMVEKISSAGKELAGNSAKFEAVAGGLALPLDEEKTKAVFHSNKEVFKDWVGKPLKKELEKALKCPVWLENDTAMGSLGEAIFGAGKKHSIVAYLTISTGIGGARIVEGKIDENSMGFEPEWQIIDKTGTDFSSKSEDPVCLHIINGKTIEKFAKKNPADITDQKFWDRVAHILAVGIHNTILYWSPDVVIVGGSVSKKISLQKVQQELQKFPYPFAKRPKIKKGVLGEKCGLYGALHLLKTMNTDSQTKLLHSKTKKNLHNKNAGK